MQAKAASGVWALLPLVFAVGVAIALLLPWASGRGAALTFNAIDLAEWTTLDPRARAETPALFTPLLIRLAVALAAIAVASLPGSRALRLLIVLAAVIALAPPFEIVEFPNDPNYQQGAIMSAIALIGGGLAVLLPRRMAVVILIAAAGLGVAAGVIGARRAVTLLEGLGLSASLGAGSIAFGAVLALAAVIAVWHLRGTRTGRRRSS